jgi:hypothetical protein
MTTYKPSASKTRRLSQTSTCFRFAVLLKTEQRQQWTYELSRTIMDSRRRSANVFDFLFHSSFSNLAIQCVNYPRKRVSSLIFSPQQSLSRPLHQGLGAPLGLEIRHELRLVHLSVADLIVSLSTVIPMHVHEDGSGIQDLLRRRRRRRSPEEKHQGVRGVYFICRVALLLVPTAGVRHLGVCAL